MVLINGRPISFECFRTINRIIGCLIHRALKNRFFFDNSASQEESGMSIVPIERLAGAASVANPTK